jgi:hypothetical protein
MIKDLEARQPISTTYLRTLVKLLIRVGETYY